MIVNNKVVITGDVVSEFLLDHEVVGKKFYRVYITVNRASSRTDTIPLLIPESLIDPNANHKCCKLKVIGEFRSHSNREETNRTLDLYVLVSEIYFMDSYEQWENNIYLDGYICKVPVYRETPLGRQITDLFIAVNRPYTKSDYIPCITWGKSAKFAYDNLSVGSRIKLYGGVQSREYLKKLSEDECEKRIAYEVSVIRSEVVTSNKSTITKEV